MDSYVATMDGFSGKLGKQSRKFKQAEGWTRHLHFGFGAEEDDPLRDVLGKKYLRNPKRPMNLRTSSISPDWWDYTCLPLDIVEEVARLTPRDLEKLSRPGFRVVFYDTLEDFYLAEALEYIHAWKQSTDDNPAGICGPIGPTEQLPLVARLVTELGLDVRSGHFWGMDEWFDVETGKEMPVTHPLSFERADREMCFNRIPKNSACPMHTCISRRRIPPPIRRRMMPGALRGDARRAGRREALGLQRSAPAQRQIQSGATHPGGVPASLPRASSICIR